MVHLFNLAALAVASGLTAAHTVITYPGWRGDNLWNNGTLDNGAIPPGSLGINYDKNGAPTFPYGMQWMYPCGGMPTSKNRTNWPIGGGGIAIQPGWFSGHASAYFYINLGIGNEPLNYSMPMVQVFQITGPSNQNYSGEFCLPQISLPPTYTPKVGDNATIQVIETAQHGAALYNCVDITFTEPKDVAILDNNNCKNESIEGHMGFNLVYATADINKNAASGLHAPAVLTGIVALAAAVMWL